MLSNLNFSGEDFNFSKIWHREGEEGSAFLAVHQHPLDEGGDDDDDGDDYE